MTADAYLYVVGTTDGPTKVGCSMMPADRLKALQRSGEKTAFLVGKWLIGSKIALAAERYVHWQLREHHIRGEWFNVSQEVAERAIQAAVAKAPEFDPRERIPALTPRGRKIRHPEHMKMRFPEGTFERIEAVMEDGEDRTDFVRVAVEREIKRRERIR